MRKFKIRASAVSRIMAKPTGKRIISTGAETYVKEWYAEQVYGKINNFTSKYTEKGNAVEDESIKFIGEYMDINILKNENSYADEYMTGTPDVIIQDADDQYKDSILEVKNSWNCFTFPLTDEEVKNKSYFYQCQVYMHLTGLTKSKLVYTLMNTPENIIENEYRRINDLSLSYQEFREHYVFDDTPWNLRIKAFDIEYDGLVIEQICDRVDACREYLHNNTNNDK